MLGFLCFRRRRIRCLLFAGRNQDSSINYVEKNLKSSMQIQKFVQKPRLNQFTAFCTKNHINPRGITKEQPSRWLYRLLSCLMYCKIFASVQQQQHPRKSSKIKRLGMYHGWYKKIPFLSPAQALKSSNLEIFKLRSFKSPTKGGSIWKIKSKENLWRVQLSENINNSRFKFNFPSCVPARTRKQFRLEPIMYNSPLLRTLKIQFTAFLLRNFFFATQHRGNAGEWVSTVFCLFFRVIACKCRLSALVAEWFIKKSEHRHVLSSFPMRV